ncbi:VanZ family protein [Cytobacillus gottheilii]|uniref:VanZ family protein n=1 Tax=Cytobacillus gottheilii TaxID=859144 RepID=UPI003CEED266
MFLINGNTVIFLGIIIYLSVRGIVIFKKRRSQINVYWFKEMLNFLFAIYICMVISVTLFPLPIGFDYQNENLFRSVNLVPLVTIIENISLIGTAYDGDTLFMIALILINVGGNILLLMPLGFLAPILWREFRHFKKVILLSLVVSITIELLQLLESSFGRGGRVTDIDDVICNVLGAIIGYLIYVLIMKIADKFKIRIVSNLDT